MDKLTIRDIEAIVRQDPYTYLNQRKGQSAFNMVYDYDPMLADSIRCTEADCFYDDTKIGKFLYAACTEEAVEYIRNRFKEVTNKIKELMSR